MAKPKGKPGLTTPRKPKTIRARKPRAQTGGEGGRRVGLIEARVPSAQDLVRAMVDKYCGPHSEQVIAALATIALGNAQSRQNFFGEPVKVQAKDRNVALQQLALRRWGRPSLTVDLGSNDPADPSRLPIQIVNVFTTETAADDGDGS